MASSALAINVHYGWGIVAVAFLTMLLTAGARGSPGRMTSYLRSSNTFSLPFRAAFLRAAWSRSV